MSKRPARKGPGRIFGLALLGWLAASTVQVSPIQAGDVDVIDAKITCEQRICRISATLKHDDTGWDHYADAWRVVTSDGIELGRRVLLHPHENEQPFTRSQDGIAIPEGISTVTVEGHDKVHGYQGQVFELIVPR